MVQTAPKRSKRSMHNRQMRFVVLGLLPIAAYFLVFSIYPIFYALFISTHKWHLLERTHAFLGLENYQWVFTDGMFYIAVKNTLYFAVLNVAFSTVLGLLVAVFVGSLNRHAVVWMRGILFTPTVTSMVAVSLVFTWLYSPSYGVLNYWLGFIGLGPFKYLQSTTQVIPSLVLVTVWKNLGYNMVIFIAGLTTIPRDLYEAASVDGANKRWQFFHVTLPLLKPTTLFVLVTGMISSLQVFTQIFNMTEGGPGTASRTMVIHIYQTAFKYFEMGRASALAFVLFAVIMAVTLVQLKLFQSDLEY